MDEDNRKGSLASFFIKLIMVIIFAIFTLWLLSSVSKGLSNSMNDINNSLNTLKDNIFYENILKMKEAGKEYFTIERLPQNVGDVKSLTLREMYDKNLLLELKDKNGNACSAENSYVRVEKFDKEYQMKVYLECGEEKNYITIIMGCYDYCSTTICEKKDDNNNNNNNTIINNNHIEYEYKKTTGGHWTDFGSWSEWSKIEINKTNYRDVETKTVDEQYTYNKTIASNQYVSFITSCPNGYAKTSDGTKCYKVDSTTETTNPVCPATYNGYILISRNRFDCSYASTATSTTSPVCPATYNGYKFVSRNGFDCTYSLTSTSTSNPVCPTKYGNGTYTSISNFTCYYKVAGGCERIKYQELVTDYCGTIICGQHYETRYKTVCQPDTTISTPASCKAGYKNINGICTSTSIKNTTVRNASCPSGYSKNNNTCTSTSTKNTTVRNASCPSGYKAYNNTCQKQSQNTKYVSLNTSCPAGYSKTSDDSRCYKEITSVVKATGTRKVTYYRYRIRQYIGGTVDIKWSRSNNDSSLIKAGYTLTGNTRTVSGK